MDLLQFLSLGVQKKASDIHFASGSPPIFRIHGDLQPLNLPPFEHQELLHLFYQILSKEQQESLQTQGEIDFGLSVNHLGRFRVNLFLQNKGHSGVFRLIPDQVQSLADLGAPKALEKIALLKQGLVLIGGSTGSGKSTTLAAMIDFINQTKSCHILTLEDPIEFIHQNKKALINQRQVYRDTANFSSALRAALREDPDIILLGEMRDLETIRLALTAAETGHLVLATVHTSSAAKTVNRIIDVFPGEEKTAVRSLLSESLQAVVCQSLQKKIDGERIAVFEIMLATSAIRNLIREDKISQMYSVMQTNVAAGMQTMEFHLQELVKKGIISWETVTENTKSTIANFVT